MPASRCSLYARTLFLCHNRFALEKKNLLSYPPQTFLRCAGFFMDLWTNDFGLYCADIAGAKAFRHADRQTDRQTDIDHIYIHTYTK
jgi:hypothetical protein